MELHDLIELLSVKHVDGPYCWVLRNVRPIEPVAAKGKQGLWDWQPPKRIEYLR